MALSEPRVIFGVHSVTPYSRTDGMPYGMLRVLDDSSLELSSDLVKLYGGSNKYPYAIEDGNFSGEMSLKFGEYPDFVFELFLGKAPTTASAETSGNVSTAANKKGTSVIHATTGIATVVVIPTTGAANLKFGKYVIKAVSATTVKVYLLSDVDINRGTDAAYADDALSVTPSALTITTGGANTDIADLGIRLTGGSGIIGMTIGDTATFEVRPINAGYTTARIGASTDTTPEFGALILAQKRATGEFFEVDAFKCKGSGLPLGFSSKNYSKVEVKAELIFDSAKDGVFDLRHVKF